MLLYYSNEGRRANIAFAKIAGSDQTLCMSIYADGSMIIHEKKYDRLSSEDLQLLLYLREVFLKEQP